MMLRTLSGRFLLRAFALALLTAVVALWLRRRGRHSARLDETPLSNARGPDGSSNKLTKQEKRLARKLEKKQKAQTVHQGVSKRQNRKMDEVTKQLRLITDVSQDVPDADLPRLVRKKFGVCEAYDSLSEDYGPVDAAAACDLLGACVQRPPLYEQKMLPQELSLIHKLFTIVGGRHASSGGGEVAIVDLGAGNGNLGLLCSLVLDCPVVLIDRVQPHAELQAENYAPPAAASRMLRFVSDVGMVDTEALAAFLAVRGIRRVAVVAKHLCGLGSDLALEFVENLSKQKGVEVLGIVVATCCVNKIDSPAQVQRYCEMYSLVDCASFVMTCTRHCTWRTTGGQANSQSKMTDWQVQMSELFEDVIQAPRLERMRKHFPHVDEVLFAPKEHTLQNRCLVGSHSGGSHQSTAGSHDEAFMSVLRDAHKDVIKMCGRAIDLCPKGIASSKYGYDSGGHS